MSNLVTTEHLSVFKHLNNCISRYEKAADALLQKFRDEALFGIAMDQSASVEDYDAVREAIDIYTKQRKVSEDHNVQTIRRDVHLAYTRKLTAPLPPLHRRHKQYKRWAKE